MLHEGDGKKMSDKILEAYEKSVLNPKEEKEEELNENKKSLMQQINSVRSALNTLEKMVKQMD